LTRITEEMIDKLGIAMLEIGFTVEDCKAALNAIMLNLTTEVLSKIKIKKED